MSMNVVYISVGIFLICVLLMNVLRNSCMNKMTRLLENEQFDEFNKVANGIVCFLVVKPFIKENMKLSAYIAQNKSRDVLNQVNMMQNMRIQPQQKILCTSNAFYYFLGNKDGKHCKEMIEFIDSLGDSKNAHNLELQYSILIKKESKYIDEIKKKLEIAQSRNDGLNNSFIIGSLQYLIGLQYFYLNDKKNMMMYFTPALENCKNTQYEQEMKEIIKNARV